MDAANFERVYDGFQQFHAFFAQAFGRKQWRERSRNYLQALLVQAGERRNAENLSESAVDAEPHFSCQKVLRQKLELSCMVKVTPQGVFSNNFSHARMAGLRRGHPTPGSTFFVRRSMDSAE